MTEETGVIHCTFSSEASLYMAYMPFITGGGIFVRTMKEFELGDEIKLVITLMDEPSEYEIECKVVWWTPRGAQGNKPAGIGVQFLGDKAQNLCNKIESLLTGMLNSTKVTDTI